MNQRTRLQLTWKNKDLRLLNHGASTYEWVETHDWRVSEVRVLQELEVVGEAGDNLLIEGDALHALTSLAAIPEYAQTYKGKVKLCYIDPPFNTGQAFAEYKDSLENSVWLTMFRDRLAQIKELLAPGGTVWVHLDDVQVHRARVVLDELFGSDNYLNTVAWQRTSAKSLAKRTMGAMHESLLIYGKGKAELNPSFLPLDADYVSRRYSNSDDRGRYDTGDLTATSHRPHLDSGKPWRGFDPSSRRRCWAAPTAPLTEAGLTSDELEAMTMRQKLDELDRLGFIHWPQDGGFPRFKKYVARAKGRAIGDLWTDVGVINSQAVERQGFSTQKPEALLQRVIQLATTPGDIVLDCFLGSGTTASVAQKMGRRWVGVELEGRTVEDFIKPRLAKVIDGSDLGGVTQVETEEPVGDLPEGMEPAAAKAAAATVKTLLVHGTFNGLAVPKGAKGGTAGGQILATLANDPAATAEVVTELIKAIRAAGKTEKTVVRNWSGGGGYRHLVVGESMFEDNSGVIVLADWATNGALAEAVAAQLRFPYEPQPPFAGKKGRQWLAVIDGMLTESLVDYLLAATESDETVVVVAQGLMPGVSDYLRAQRKGSRARKVPRDLAHRSARTERIDTSTPNGDEDQ